MERAAVPDVHSGVSSTVSAETRREVFDRNRLLVDLDEATDPSHPPTVLLVAGLRSLGSAFDAQEDADTLLTRVRERFGAVVGDTGATYHTRANELCAIIDSAYRSQSLVAQIKAAIAQETDRPERVVWALVELPHEACDAIAALTLADGRLSGSRV